VVVQELADIADVITKSKRIVQSYTNCPELYHALFILCLFSAAELCLQQVRT